MTELPGPAARADVGRRSAHSGAVQVGAQAVLLAMSLVSGFLMARLLVPADFGVVAMASTLTAFVATFRGFGFSMALVQADQVAEDDLERLYRIGLRYTLWLGVGMLVAAPLLARAYHEPRLTAVLIAVTAGSVAMSLAELPEAMATRAMQFADLRRIEIASVAVGMVIGLVSAWLGASYWALVMQNTATALVRAAMTWRLVTWRPRRGGAATHTPHAMLGFARHYAATNVVTFAAQNVDRVTLALSSGAYSMGLYDLAYRWGHYPVWQLYPPLLNVAVAGLSRARADETMYRHYWRTALLLILSAMLPALTFFAIESRAFILTLLGRGWTDAIVVFRYVTIGAMALALTRHTRWLFLSEGRTEAQLRMSVMQFVVTAVAMLIGMRWQVMGIAIAYAASRWLLVVPELALAFSASPVTWGDYGRVVWRPMLASVLAGVALLAASASLPEVPVQRLALAAALYLGTYVAAWLVLPGGVRALRELMGVAQRMREHVGGTD